MFEARLTQGNMLKKLVDAVKELCKEVNWDINAAGMSMQSMDSSHVCLVAFNLRSDCFDHYRCDRPLTLGINLENLAKILKCAGNNDIVTLKADDNGDTLTLVFESEKQDRISEVDLKLMSIESEHLGIPEQDYSVDTMMPAAEYQRIARDLGSIGDTVLISATKEGIKFSTTGDIGTANVTLRQTASAEKEEEQVSIDLKEPVALTFSLRYLNNFAKATPLSTQVQVSLTKDLPVMVSYKIGDLGHIKYYLAPKIDEEEAAAADE